MTTNVQEFLANYKSLSTMSLASSGSLMHVDQSDTPRSLTLVALPSDTSEILPIGSEEKHASLLFFGDDVDPTVAALVRASIEGFIRDRGIAPFVESVSSVATLGDGGARVWLIDSDNGLRALQERLNYIPAIKALTNTVEQYPNYTPHVTIGYADEGQDKLSGLFESLAAEVKQIKFDRIALWYGNNHDVVWKLRYPEMADSVEAAHEGMLTKLGNFLAHHGIKGMKWGVRRSDAQLAKAAESGDASSSSPSSSKVSEDAAKFIATTQKPPVELSDQEINAVLQRARITKQYDEIFNPAPNANAELRAQVEKLRLEKEFSQLNSELNPSAAARVASLIKSANQGYQTFAKLDDATGGKMTDEIRKKLGLPKPPETRQQMLKREIGILKTEKDHAKLLEDLRKLGAESVPKHSSGVSVGRHVAT